MNATIPTNGGEKTIGELVADLTYLNYASNRDRSPEITPERWGKVYGAAAVEQFEVRYQAEKAINKARIDAELDEWGL